MAGKVKDESEGHATGCIITKLLSQYFPGRTKGEKKKKTQVRIAGIPGKIWSNMPGC